MYTTTGRAAAYFEIMARKSLIDGAFAYYLGMFFPKFGLCQTMQVVHMFG